MAAVASVILNRANNPRWWGRNIIQVCLMPWQFSCWNPDDVNRRQLLAVTEKDAQFRTALGLADKAIVGDLADETNHADHFHTHAVAPLWSRGQKPVATIGNHRFFRLELRERPTATTAQVKRPPTKRPARGHDTLENDEEIEVLDHEDD